MKEKRILNLNTIVFRQDDRLTIRDQDRVFMLRHESA